MSRQMTARKPDHQRRVLRPRKRNQDIAEGTTVKRRNVRMSVQKPSDPLTTTTDFDDGIYTPEFQRIDTIEDNYFKIKIPGTVKLRKQMVRLEKQYGGKVPKNVLQDLLRPRLIRFGEEYRAKGSEFQRHLLDLWKMEDVWTFPVDNSFAASFFTQIEQMSLRAPASRLCTRCTGICLYQSTRFGDTGRKMRGCGVCKILSQPRLNASDEALILKHNHHSSIRICAAPGSKAALLGMQIGFPMLPENGSRFELFREWMRVCGEDHKNFECCPKTTSRLPTRVLDVSDNRLRLHVSSPGERGEYVALSHCWGTLSQGQKRSFCTSSANLKLRCTQDLDIDTLPKTFQDAITVTRELGKRYLWIDSICIIQYDDDLEDWRKESGQMGNTFGNAYVTIAATSARDATQGFLERPRLQDSNLQYAKVHTSSHGTLYVSGIVDDYQSDVENGVLNQRAWVLQERALSRRTIHFTANQTYWECGGGVRCETLTRMRNSKALFLADPKFPASLMHRRTNDKIRLFQHLFERYSQLSITDPTDRPIAIFGLVDRLAETFKMRASHGIFEDYLHRSLLWHRAGTARMQRIQFAPDRQVPSWSWMASSGQIEYRKAECCKVEWNSEIQLTDGALQAPTRRLKQCKVEPRDDGACDVRSAANGVEMGWVRFDGTDIVDVRTVKCVVVGRDVETCPKHIYHVLVVTPVGRRKEVMFERVGIGSLPRELLCFQTRPVTVRMV